MENEEQARLLGMGSEREAKLRGEVERLRRELAVMREDEKLLDKLDALISTEETQRLFLLPTRRDCGSIREALRVATSCHVPEEAK
jgi:hypothetical protein